MKCPFSVKTSFKMAALLILAFVIVLVCAVTFVRSGREIAKGISTNSWPITYGTITSVFEARGMDGNGRFFTKVRYEYEVDARRYAGRRVRYGFDVFRGEGRVYDVMFNKGGTIQVFYNPDEPSDSVLVTGVSFRPFVFLLLSGLMSFFFFRGIWGLVKEGGKEIDQEFWGMSFVYLLVAGVAILLLWMEWATRVYAISDATQW